MLRITTILFALAVLGSACPATATADGLRWPVDGAVVTEFRTGSDPYAAGQHRGIDIAAGLDTVVVAPASGEVTYSGRLPDGGETVTLRAGDKLLSHLHLATREVKRGDSVAAGEPLGTVGLTGKRSIEQPHLHFSVRDAATKKYIDPMSVLTPKPVVPMLAEPVPMPQRVAPQKQREPSAKPKAKRVASDRPAVRISEPVERPAAQALHIEKAAGARSPKPEAAPDTTLRAPAPFPAAAETQTSVVAPTPRLAEPVVQQGQRGNLHLRTVAAAVALMLIAMLALRGRRGRRRPAPPAAPREQVAEVVPIGKAS